MVDLKLQEALPFAITGVFVVLVALPSPIRNIINYSSSCSALIYHSSLMPEGTCEHFDDVGFYSPGSLRLYICALPECDSQAHYLQVGFWGSMHSGHWAETVWQWIILLNLSHMSIFSGLKAVYDNKNDVYVQLAGTSANRRHYRGLLAWNAALSSAVEFPKWLQFLGLIV